MTEDEVAAIEPPNVLAANEFEFEILGRRFAADTKDELEIRRKIKIDLSACDRIPAVSMKIESDAIDVAFARDMHLHTIRWMRRPGRG